MATKFLDKTGLSHFWSKIKAWALTTFAAITHNQASNTINAMTGYSKPSSGSAIVTSDSLNDAIGKLEAKVDVVTTPTIPDLSRTISGSGNAITDITVSGHAITATKGSTFLTSHQSLANYVTLNGAQTISAVKTFTAKPVLNQVGLDMTVKDTTEGSTTTRTSQVLHANSSNTQYGINIAFCSGGNAVVGGGEAGTAQLNALAGNSDEDLYLVADGNIYLKPNCNKFANAKTITIDTAANMSGLGTVTASAFVGVFPVNTRMIFQQSAAPTGWTKETNSGYNNTALRFVTGNIANKTNGKAFTTCMATGRATANATQGGTIGNQTATGTISKVTAGGTVGNRALSIAQLPAHAHDSVWQWAQSGNSNLYASYGPATNKVSTGETGSGSNHNHSFTGSEHQHTFTGSAHNHTFTGSSHSHTIDLDINYIDCIIASKA